MSFNFDYTRKDGTEVMVCYRMNGGGTDFFANGHWNPADPLEVDFENKVYGLPDGETLTAEEWYEIEQAILENPPDYESFDDDYF